jgi:valyl-tRNA synthetase
VSQPIDAVTYEATIGLFEDVLKLLHPYMPFLTEELWHHLRERKEGRGHHHRRVAEGRCG